MRKRILCGLVACLLPGLAAAQTSSPNDAGKPAPPASHERHQVSALDVSTGSYTFTGSEPTMTPRFLRSGSAGGACGTIGFEAVQYWPYTFRTDGSGSLTATVDPGTCDTGVYVTFHRVSFDPANICTNHVWANGSSLGFSASFSVPANTEMVMVMSGVRSAPTVVCGPVSFSLDGTAAAVPAMTWWALWALAGGLAVAGAWTIRRRSRAV